MANVKDPLMVRLQQLGYGTSGEYEEYGIPWRRAKRGNLRKAKPFHQMPLTAGHGSVSTITDVKLGIMRTSAIAKRLVMVRNSNLSCSVELNNWGIGMGDLWAFLDRSLVTWQTFRAELLELLTGATAVEITLPVYLSQRNGRVPEHATAITVDIQGLDKVGESKLGRLLELLTLSPWESPWDNRGGLLAQGEKALEAIQALRESEFYQEYGSSVSPVARKGWINLDTGKRVNQGQLSFMDGDTEKAGPALHFTESHGWSVARAIELTDFLESVQNHVTFHVLQGRQVVQATEYEFNTWKDGTTMSDWTVARSSIQYSGADGEFAAVLVTHFGGIWIHGTDPGSGLFHTRLVRPDAPASQPLLHIVLRAETWAQAVVGHTFALAELKARINTYLTAERKHGSQETSSKASSHPVRWSAKRYQPGTAVPF